MVATANLRSWLTQTITIAQVTGRNNTGDPTYGSQSTVNARVEVRNTLVIGRDNQEVTSGVRVVTEDAINIDSRVWLPGASTADNNEASRPIAQETAQRKRGTGGFYITYF